MSAWDFKVLSLQVCGALSPENEFAGAQDLPLRFRSVLRLRIHSSADSKDFRR